MHTFLSNCLIFKQLLADIKQLLVLASKSICLQAIAYVYAYGFK